MASLLAEATKPLTTTASIDGIMSLTFIFLSHWCKRQLAPPLPIV